MGDRSGSEGRVLSMVQHSYGTESPGPNQRLLISLIYNQRLLVSFTIKDH